ncbi:uncharacterized protein LOC125178283 [Hyalella azteca]|uniref:Uncharacterized protein LOC125178283 n=1 Tax=Hyalella azteca TaxID=294128 RepID=A0A979FM97_HYAAZ|nr:uncharacterized protein LOC125178283 [Hyalella azteca]
MPAAAPQLLLNSCTDKSNGVVTSCMGDNLGDSPHSQKAWMSSLTTKRDSTYSSMSERSVSPMHSARNSLCSSAGYASQLVSPNMDAPHLPLPPLPHASGQLTLSLTHHAGVAGGGKLVINIIEARGLTHPHQWGAVMVLL